MTEKQTENLPVKAEAEPVEAVLVQADGPDVDMPPEMITELVERRLAARTRILRAALNKGVIGKGAFTIHGSGDRAKPSLNGEAVMRVAPILGIVVEFQKDEHGDMAFKKRPGKDDDPDEPRFYDVEISGTGWYADRPKWKVEGTGSASTRDGFFRRGRPSKREPLEAVSEGNVRKKAQVNLWSRIGQVLLGVKGLSVEEIKAAGYSFDDSTTIAHDGKGAPQAPRSGPRRSPRPASAGSGKEDLRPKLREALLEIAGNDVETASALLESYTEFEGDKGTVRGVQSVNEKRFTDGWVYRTWLTVEKKLEEHRAGQGPVEAPEDLDLPDEDAPAGWA